MGAGIRAQLPHPSEQSVSVAVEEQAGEMADRQSQEWGPEASWSKDTSGFLSSGLGGKYDTETVG